MNISIEKINTEKSIKKKPGRSNIEDDITDVLKFANSNLTVLDIHNILTDRFEKEKKKIILLEDELKELSLLKLRKDIIEEEKKILFNKEKDLSLKIDQMKSNDENNYYLKTIFIIQESIDLESKIDGMKVNDYIIKRREIKERYLRELGINIINNKDNSTKIERKCDCDEFELTVTDDEVTCDSCGLVYSVYIDNTFEHTSYTQLEQLTQHVDQIYEKKNHFLEIWAQKQAKHNSSIPQKIMDVIYDQIKKRKIKDVSTLTAEDIKMFLKRTGNSMYYEQIYSIMKKLNIKTDLEFNNNLSAKVETMFKEYEKAYEIVKDKTRKSSISYNFVIFKILTLLSCDEYRKRFTLPKDQNKRNEYEKIWKRVCSVLNWEYIE